MRAYENVYINGKWVPSAGEGSLEVTDSATEEVIASVPNGAASDVDAAVAAAKAAFPGWSALPAARARRLPHEDPCRPRGPHRRDRPDHRQRGRHAADAGEPHPGRLAEGQLQIAAGPRRLVRVRDQGRQLPRGPRGHRRGRLHHPVELPAAPDRPQGRSRTGRRQHRRAQAERSGTDQTRSSSPK